MSLFNYTFLFSIIIQKSFVKMKNLAMTMVFLKHIHNIACFYEFHLRFVCNVCLISVLVTCYEWKRAFFIRFDELNMMAKNKANKVQSRWKLDNNDNEELIDKNFRFLQNLNFCDCQKYCLVFLFYYNFDSRFGSNSEKICAVDSNKFKHSFCLIKRKSTIGFFSENFVDFFNKSLWNHLISQFFLYILMN